MGKSKSEDTRTTEEGKIFALLAYLSILCIIPLVFKKNNPFVLHHGKQGLILFVVEVALFVLHIILGQWILDLGIFVFGVISLVGMVYVLKGSYFKLPIIYPIAEKITL